MNGEYMKKMDDDKFYEMALPYLKETITKIWTSTRSLHGKNKNRSISGYQRSCGFL